MSTDGLQMLTIRVLMVLSDQSKILSASNCVFWSALDLAGDADFSARLWNMPTGRRNTRNGNDATTFLNEGCKEEAERVPGVEAGRLDGRNETG